jgi:hypothetical protein
VPVPQWSSRPERLVIDCRAQAGPAHGRPATPSDAARVVALVNVAHDREELFVPYTAARLAERLGRGRRVRMVHWRQARRDVWPGSRGAVDGREGACARSSSTPASGAEAELVALRDWCAALRRAASRI